MIIMLAGRATPATAAEINALLSRPTSGLKAAYETSPFRILFSPRSRREFVFALVRKTGDHKTGPPRDSGKESSGEYMVDLSTSDKKFLNTLELWFREQPEILVIFRYSRAAGAKDFEFISTYKDLVQRLLRLPPSTNIIAFKQPQLPIRGVVDNAFIKKCATSIPQDSEFLLLEITPRTAGNTSWFHHSAGESHDELRAALEDVRGRRVAVGLYPPWQDESSKVISGIVPDEKGEVRLGIY